MTKSSLHVVSALFAFSVGACGSSVSSNPPAAQESKQTLSFAGDCTATACSAPPSNLATEPAVTCTGSMTAACQWAATNEDGTVSYRECSAAECPEKPAITCPAGTTLASQACGSENEAACGWTSSCVPPRDTTPCPRADGCDDQPMIEIGIICKDGTTGAFACVTDGKQCQLERNCD